MTAAVTPALVDVDGAAKYLACSVRHIERLLANGQLRSVKLGRLRRISTRALDEYWSQLEDAR